MADKQISFSIQVEGNEKILKNLTEAQKAVKELNKELKATEDQDVYEQKEKELVKAKAALSEFRKEQKNQIREFKAAQNQAGSYEELNAQLVRARQEFKKLGAAERESAAGQKLVATIQDLDAELKELDQSIGQNQRNVGNYGEAFSEALSGVGGQFGEVINGFKGIGQAASNAGNLISKAFVAFQAVQLIVEAVGYVDEFVDATREAQRQVSATFGTIGEETDAIVVKVQALSDTFSIEFDESLRATNALVQQFGVSAEEATDLLTDGLISSANGAEFLGRATDDLGKLSSAGIDASEAIGLIAETTNKGINVDIISEGIISLRENAEGTADAIENAFGPEKAAQIAEAFKEEPIEALKLVAAEQKKLDQNSKESAELIANVFKGVGEENIKSVQAIADLNGNLDELVETTGEYGQKINAVSAANEDFAAAQVQVANTLKDAVGNTEAFTTNVKTGLLVVLDEVLKALQPAIDLFKEFSNNLSETEGTIDKVRATASFLGDALKVLITIIVELFKFQKSLIDGFIELINKIPFVSEAVSQLAAGLKNFTSVIAGVRAALSQLAENVSITFKDILLGLEIFAKQAEELVSFGKADERVKQQLAELRAQREELNKERLGVVDAFRKAFEESKREELDAQIKADLEAKKAAEDAERKKFESVKKERAKGNAEARRKAEEEAKKELEALEKAQQKFIQEQSKLELERAALLLELGKRVRDNQIALLEDAGEARRATIEAQYADELEALQQQADAVAAAQEEREQKAIELFGENSQEVINLRNQQAQELASILDDIAVLETQALERRNKDLIDLEKDLAEQRQAVREKELNDNLADIDRASSVEQLKLRQRFADGLITEQEYTQQSNQLAQDRLQAQINAFDEELRALENLRAQGIAIDEEYYRQLGENRQEAQTQLAETQNSERERQVQQNLDQINQIGDFVQQGLQQIDAIYAGIAAREIERIEQRRAAQEEELTILQEQFEQASGLQRVALKQQIDQELKEKDRLAKEQERIEKREAERQKRVAIAQALINGALAVTNILATVPKADFGVSTALLIGAAIASTAAQVAVISSQQFAKGGILDGPSHAQGGIKTRFGELEGGEAVINKRSTAMFKPMLSKINEAGGGRKFAVGGVLSSPIVAPTSAETELNAFTNALGENFNAINNRFDRMQVVLNTDEEEREAQDRQENINIATLTTDNG